VQSVKLQVLQLLPPAEADPPEPVLQLKVEKTLFASEPHCGHSMPSLRLELQSFSKRRLHFAQKNS
jgi:hypothetical protein